jgi:hypothetical protein
MTDRIFTFEGGISADLSSIRMVGVLKPSIGKSFLLPVVLAGVGNYDIKLSGEAEAIQADADRFRQAWADWKDE